MARVSPHLSCSLADFGFTIQRNATQEFGLVQGTASHMADLAVKGSTLTIEAADDLTNDFYLLIKVMSKGVGELDNDYTDDYESTAFEEHNCCYT